MNSKAEQKPATKAIAEIKEQVQLDRWQQQIEERQRYVRYLTLSCAEGTS